jgi:hypothetical protein
MKKVDILERLGKRELTADEGGEIVLKNLKLLPEIFKGVSSPNKRIKNATAKILRTVSEQYPEKLYPKFDFFVENMNRDDTILKWLAMDTIANMVTIDKKNKIDKVLKKYYDMLSDESMITAAHSVESLGKIAKFKPDYRAEITNQLYKIKTIKRGSECRNILLGKVFLSFENYIDQIDDKKKMIAFAKKELKNKRSGTVKKAERFIKKYQE